MKLEITFSDGKKYLEKFVDKESVQKLMEMIKVDGFEGVWGNPKSFWLNLSFVRTISIDED